MSLQEVIDKNPNKRYVQTYEFGELKDGVQQIIKGDLIDLRDDLIQIDRKFLVNSNCTICNHGEFRHNMEVPYRRKNFKVITTVGTAWSVKPMFSWNYPIDRVVEDQSKYEIKDYKMTNCEDCRCEEYTPSDEYMLLMVDQWINSKQQHANVEEYYHNERVAKYFYLKNKPKTKYYTKKCECK